MNPEPPTNPVEACAACGLLLDVAQLAPLTVVECPGCAKAITVLREFGPFVLERLLGTGGMGAVYEARDTTLRRSIALKVLQRSWSHDAGLTAQFEREAALTARVNHPNVVRVFSTGKAHGMFYIAMELVDKGSLDGWMDAQRKVPEADVLLIGIQVAEGLEAASRAGLIHRDVKPANILFAENRQAKIVDFGLALQLNQAQSDLGEIWGTPFYISPEALDKQPEDLRSDMYALGSTLWHALTGAPPYPCDTTVIQELLELKKRPVHLLKAAPGVHPKTAAALERAMHPVPSRRFENYAALASAFREALEALQTKPIAVQPIRPKGKRMAAALLTGAAIVSASFWWIQQKGPREPESAATFNLLSDTERLQKACEQMQDLAQLDQALRRLELISRSPNLPPEVQVWTAIAIGTGYALKGDPTKQLSLFQEALPDKTPPEWTPFLQRLEAVFKTPPGVAPPNSADTAKQLPPEQEALALFWASLRLVHQEKASEALIPLGKATAAGGALQNQPAATLLGLLPTFSSRLAEILELEKELSTPASAQTATLRAKRLETLLADPLSQGLFRKKIELLVAKAKTQATPPPAPAAATSAKNPPPQAGNSQPPVAKSPPTKQPPQTPSPSPPAAKPQSAQAPAPNTNTPFPEEVRTRILRNALAFQFSEARKELGASQTPQNGNAWEEKQRLLRQVGEVETLFRWSLQSINQGGTLPSPLMRNGATFKSDPVQTDGKTLHVRVGSAPSLLPVSWQEISPLYLIKLLLSRSASLANPAQKAELLWGAGTVHSMMGAAKNARDFYEEAAKLHPEYQSLLQALPAEVNP